MIEHTNGDVTLTKQEIDELGAAYASLYGIISDSPTDPRDCFTGRGEYENVSKWRAWFESEEDEL